MDFTNLFRKFTKQPLLLRLDNKIVNFQNSSSLVEFLVNMRRQYDIDMTLTLVSRHHINVVLTSSLYCDNSYYLYNCSTYNTFCLRSENIQSIFNFIVIAVAVTPHSFIFKSITCRKLVNLFGFCVSNLPAKYFLLIL